MKEAEKITIGNVPTAPHIPKWFRDLAKQVSAASSLPDAAFKWILECKNPSLSLDDLQNSGDFSSLDIKLSTACEMVLTGEVQRNAELLAQKYEH